MRWTIAVSAGAVMIAGAPLQAEPESPREAAPVFKSLVECRAIKNDAQRLACYDGKVAAIDTAERSGDIVVADKAQIRESHKALFGFGTIHLPVFGRNDSAEDLPTEIQATITAVSDTGYGKFEYTLDNGMRWRQTEASNNLPRAGQSIVIKSAALGSYFLKVGKSSAVRAMRVR